MDDSSTNNDVEMLNNMAIRQRRFIQDLENALIRIQNKVYGVCTVTGELIDKKRLLAVPTTTKSLAAKTQAPLSRRPLKPEEEKEPGNKKKAGKTQENKVISRVIKKSGNAAKTGRSIDLEEEEDEDNYDLEELEVDEEMIGEEEEPQDEDRSPDEDKEE
jgi:RNA polymerase-binding transcription factor DksA